MIFDLEKVQAHMRETGVGAWLVYDFRGSNPVFWQLLGQRRKTSRRVFLSIPDAGEPRLLGSAVEPDALAGLGVDIELYVSWAQMQKLLRGAVGSCGKVAMEYVPGGELPIMSWVDGGTLEMVRALGPEIASSADLCQIALATWSAEALASHRDACLQVAEVKDAAFEHIRYGLENHTALTEYEVQEFIAAEFAKRDLDMDHPPIVGVNHNSGNPHYEPSRESFAPIRHGDWILIDLWARHPGEQHVFGDITWVAFAGRRVPEAQAEVFAIVREARDQVVERLRQAWAGGEALQGWQLDRVARDLIAALAIAARWASTSTTWRPTTHGRLCRGSVSRSSRGSISRNSACAWKSTCTSIPKTVPR